MRKELSFPKGYQKQQNAWESCLSSKSFNEAILVLRAKYKIPLKGFNFNGVDLEDQVFIGPVGWAYSFSKIRRTKKVDAERIKALENLNADLKLLLTSRGLNTFTWLINLKGFLFFNNGYINKGDLFKDSSCILVHTEEDYSSHQFISSNELTQQARKYPLLIKISPNTTLNDIRSLVKSLGPYIVEELKKYPKANMTGYKARSNVVTERDRIIIENRDKSYKEIFHLIPKNIRGKIDEGSIGKIISRYEKS